MSHNILLLLDGMPAGGLERQIVELLKGMRESTQFKMFLGVLVKGGAREEEAQRYAHGVLPIRQKSPFDLTLALSLLKFIPEYNIDCIHSFGSISDVCAVFAGKIKKIPVVNGSVRSTPPRLYGRYRLSRMCMPFATWIVGNSHAGLKAFGIHRFTNTNVIYNGMALDRFCDIGGLSRRNAPELCMVANFTSKKDQESLVRSFPLILGRYPGTRLTLVGRGEKKISYTQRLITSLGVDDDIEIVAQTDHPESYIDRCDVCILLTKYAVHGEGISNSIMEYMALSKPVIATDCGGNGELIENGRTGILVTDHNPDTLFEAIDRLLDNKALAKKMGEYGRERLDTRFSLYEMVHGYKKLYGKILAPNTCPLLR